MDRTEVGLLQQLHQVGLGGVLQRLQGAHLEAQPGEDVVLRQLAHQSLKGQSGHEQLGSLLVAANLAQGHRARAVAVALPRLRLSGCSGGCCCLFPLKLRGLTRTGLVQGELSGGSRHIAFLSRIIG